MNDDIEFLLPFYGDPQLFRDAVTSVRRQIDESWTLRVHDDGFPDLSIPTWVADLKDPRITYERNEVNLGARKNYRKALESSTATYVVVMGADDLLLPDYLSTVRALVRRGDADVVQPGVRVIDQNGKPVRPLGDRIKTVLGPSVAGPTVHSGQSVAASLMNGNWTYFPSLVWRRQLIDTLGFRDYDVVQDLALLVDVLLGGGRLLVDDHVVFEYRRHGASDSSVSSHNGGRFSEERRYYAAIASEFDERGWPRAARSARRHVSSRLHALTLLPELVKDGEWGASRGLLRHAFGS